MGFGFESLIPVGIELLGGLLGGDSGGSQAAASQADPFASQRGQYQPMLSSLVGQMMGNYGSGYYQQAPQGTGGYSLAPAGGKTSVISGLQGFSQPVTGGNMMYPGGSSTFTENMPQYPDAVAAPPSMGWGGSGGGYQEIMDNLISYIATPSFSPVTAPSISMPEAGPINSPSAALLDKLMANPGDLASSPLYKFAFEQGQQGVERSVGARGLLGSGNRLAALTEFGQGLAGQQYFGQANLLSGLAGQERQTALGQQQIASNQAIAQMNAQLQAQQINANMQMQQASNQMSLLGTLGNLQQNQWSNRFNEQQFGFNQQQAAVGNQMNLAQLLASLSGATSGSPSTAGQIAQQGVNYNNQAQGQLVGAVANFAGSPTGQNLLGSLFGGGGKTTTSGGYTLPSGILGGWA